MASNLKRSLSRDGLLESYTESFIDMEKRGAIRELTQSEMDQWEARGGPVNFCSHHGILKDNKNTKFRSVCNSSLSHNGTSLNQILPKGPTAISNLLHVFLRWQTKSYTLIQDIKKAYQNLTVTNLNRTIAMPILTKMKQRPVDLLSAKLDSLHTC